LARIQEIRSNVETGKGSDNFRYINHLRINKDLFEWKKEDEERMIELHH
jgi:hypothetical protein